MALESIIHKFANDLSKAFKPHERGNLHEQRYLWVFQELPTQSLALNLLFLEHSLLLSLFFS